MRVPGKGRGPVRRSELAPALCILAGFCLLLAAQRFLGPRPEPRPRHTDGWQVIGPPHDVNALLKRPSCQR
jgi:hypothetical protein